MSAPPHETTPVEPDLIEPNLIETSLDSAVEVFLAVRSRLCRVAFRVTGDPWTAEDVVQEAWLRWQHTDRAVIQNAEAFLTTITTHLSLNLVLSARARHEAPAGSHLDGVVDPEPDAYAHAERAAQVEQTLAALMTRLNPNELAAYVLRKGFDYTYCTIAVLLRTSIPNTRQLVRRAQIHIEGHRGRSIDPRERRVLAEAFLRAARTGDLPGLEHALTAANAPVAHERGGGPHHGPSPRPIVRARTSGSPSRPVR